jgi:hypothetical protein
MAGLLREDRKMELLFSCANRKEVLSFMTGTTANKSALIPADAGTIEKEIEALEKRIASGIAYDFDEMKPIWEDRIETLKRWLADRQSLEDIIKRKDKRIDEWKKRAEDQERFRKQETEGFKAEIERLTKTSLTADEARGIILKVAKAAREGAPDGAIVEAFNQGIFAKKGVDLNDGTLNGDEHGQTVGKGDDSPSRQNSSGNGTQKKPSVSPDHSADAEGGDMVIKEGDILEVTGKSDDVMKFLKKCEQPSRQKKEMEE